MDGAARSRRRQWSPSSGASGGLENEENNMQKRESNHLVFVVVGLAAALASGGCGGSVPYAEETVGREDQALQVLRPYLALGDSVAFGYNPVDAKNDPTNPAAFVGYP